MKKPALRMFITMGVWMTISTIASFATALESAPRPRSNNLVSIHIVQDFGLNQATDPCSFSGQTNAGFSCFRASGSQYHGTPLPDASTDISGAPQLATTRVLAGYDRLVKDHYLFGARLGWVFRGGGPRPDGARGPDFLPFHGEARVGYLFGSAPLGPNGVRFSVFVNGGLAQVDTLHRLTIREDLSKPPPAAQLDNPSSQELAAYHKSGTGFLGAGVNVAYYISRGIAISASPKFMRLFPSAGNALSLEFGAVMAF